MILFSDEDSSLFRVFCLSHLFYEIRNKCSLEIPSVAIMKSELEKDVFSYARDLGCYVSFVFSNKEMKLVVNLIKSVSKFFQNTISFIL